MALSATTIGHCKALIGIKTEGGVLLGVLLGAWCVAEGGCLVSATIHYSLDRERCEGTHMLEAGGVGVLHVRARA